MCPSELMKNLELLQCQYLCCKPIKLIDWKNILQNLSWDNQETLLNSTLNSPFIQDHNLPISYRVSFLRHIISELEQQKIEVHDSLYELFVVLLEDSAKSPPKYSYKHYRLMEYNTTISIKESQHMISDGTTGLHSWQASGALSEWAIHNPHRITGKKVLELGAGTGLTGFIISKVCRPNKIVLTDGNPLVLGLLEDNYKINVPHGTSGNISIECLDWDNITEPRILEQIVPDVILAADVVYDNSLFLPLGHTIDFLFTKCMNRCVLILTCTVRNEDTHNAFMDLLDSLKFKRTEEKLVRPTHIYWDDKTPIKIYSITRDEGSQM